MSILTLDGARTATSRRTRPSPRRGRTAAAALVAAVAALVLTSVTACARRASAEECRAMADHYLDLVLAESPGGGALSKAQASAVRLVEDGVKRAEPSYRRVVERCEEVDHAAVSCAMGAATARDRERCLHAEGGAAVVR